MLVELETELLVLSDSVLGVDLLLVYKRNHPLDVIGKCRTSLCHLSRGK